MKLTLSTELQLVPTLMDMYPDLKPEDFRIYYNQNGEYEIDEWTYNSAFPSKESIIDHWNTFKDKILDSLKPDPDKFEVLEQTQADLIFQLMMNGVI